MLLVEGGQMKRILKETILHLVDQPLVHQRLAHAHVACSRRRVEWRIGLLIRNEHAYASGEELVDQRRIAHACRHAQQRASTVR
eukprot:645138-Prymnesium_polylepis.2